MVHERSGVSACTGALAPACAQEPTRRHVHENAVDGARARKPCTSLLRPPPVGRVTTAAAVDTAARQCSDGRRCRTSLFIHPWRSKQSVPLPASLPARSRPVGYGATRTVGRNSDRGTLRPPTATSTPLSISSDHRLIADELVHTCSGGPRLGVTGVSREIERITTKWVV